MLIASVVLPGNELILSPFINDTHEEVIGIMVNLSSPINVSDVGGNEGVCSCVLSV